MKHVSILTLLILLPVFASGFEVKEAGNALLKWNLVKGPVQITLNPSNLDGATMSSAEKSIQASLKMWQNVPGQNVRFQYKGRSTSAVANSQDLQNSILWIKSGWAYSSSTLAITRYSYYSDSGEIVDADILFNGQKHKWGTNLKQNGEVVDIQQVLNHELGHLLGLSHSSVLLSSLYPYLPAKVYRSISKDDKAGIQFIYGPPMIGFQQITPVHQSSYPKNMTSRSLPLPVFRWGRGSGSTFTLQFSNDPEFTNAVSLNAGPSGSYQMKAADERKLANLSRDGKVYWRVVSGQLRTGPSWIRFKETNL